MAGTGAHKRGSVTEAYRTNAPGVYLDKKFGLPRRTMFLTGVPAFLGPVPVYDNSQRLGAPVMLSLWSQYLDHVGTPGQESYLPYGVRGFFENGGERCYVVPLEDNSSNSLMRGLEAIQGLNTIDLVVAPDLVRDRAATFELQQAVVNHCQSMGDRFAILDSRQGDNSEQVWEQWSETDGTNGAIYYPWIRVKRFDGAGEEMVPPSGHIAGVYARTDHTRGVHKAPANESLNGVIDLERHLTDTDQSDLNRKHINCLRWFPGRGIKVWGARTLCGQDSWTYVNVRRLFLTVVRWIDWNMQDVVFETNSPKLWARIERELSSYFVDLYRAGALSGRTPQEAFYVKCDAETNPSDLRNAGRVVTEIGLATTIPFEFVVVRLIHDARGVTLSGPGEPGQI